MITIVEIEPTQNQGEIIVPNRIAIPAHRVAKDVKKMLTDLYKDIETLGKLPPGCSGITVDGKIMFRGDVLFELKATHGFPLDFALDSIINDKGMAVNWPEFIETARKNQWWDFQTYDVILHAMEDAQIPKDIYNGIKYGFQRYVMKYPNPRRTDLK
jgi:hypothetical protein